MSNVDNSSDVEEPDSRRSTLTTRGGTTQRQRPQSRADGRKNEVGTKRGLAKLAALGSGAGFVAWVLSNADGKKWDELIRKILNALLEQNGPAPAFIVIAFAALIATIIVSYQSHLKSKDKEIDRLAGQNAELEKRIDRLTKRS